MKMTNKVFSAFKITFNACFVSMKICVVHVSAQPSVKLPKVAVMSGMWM